VVVVTNKRDTSRAGELTEKKIYLPVYFVFAVQKNASVGKQFCVVVSLPQFRIILKTRFWMDSIRTESDWGML